MILEFIYCYCSIAFVCLLNFCVCHILLLLRPVREAEYCDGFVCLCVCVCVCVSMTEHINKNGWTDLHQIFCACPLGPWLGPPPGLSRYVMYLCGCRLYQVVTFGQQIDPESGVSRVT